MKRARNSLLTPTPEVHTRLGSLVRRFVQHDGTKTVVGIVWRVSSGGISVMWCNGRVGHFETRHRESGQWEVLVP